MVAVLIAVASAGCDSAPPPLADDAFRMTLNGSEVRGRAAYSPAVGTVRQPEVSLIANSGTLRIQSDALSGSGVDGPVGLFGATYFPEAGLGPYSYRSGDLDVTTTERGIEGEFDLLLRTSDGLFSQDEIRVRGAFRVTR